MLTNLVANFDSKRLDIKNVSSGKKNVRPLQNSLQQIMKNGFTQQQRGITGSNVPLSKQNRSILWTKCCVGAVATFAVLYWLSQQITSGKTSVFLPDSCNPCIANPCKSDDACKGCFGTSSPFIEALCNKITLLESTIVDATHTDLIAQEKCMSDLQGCRIDLDQKTNSEGECQISLKKDLIDQKKCTSDLQDCRIDLGKKNKSEEECQISLEAVKQSNDSCQGQLKKLKNQPKKSPDSK